MFLMRSRNFTFYTSVGSSIEQLDSCSRSLGKLVLELYWCSFQHSVGLNIDLLGIRSFLLGKLVLELALCSKNGCSFQHYLYRILMLVSMSFMQQWLDSTLGGYPRNRISLKVFFFNFKRILGIEFRITNCVSPEMSRSAQKKFDEVNFLPAV